MILLFPDPDTFHLALTGGFVPAEIAAAKGAVAFNAHGHVSVETNGKLPRKAGADLARLGVTSTKRHVGPATPVMCWPQIHPAVRDAAPPQLSSQTPVLFELESGTDLPVLVGEMLRLGNDRQSVRWLDGDNGRVLLRVIGPPYYTLLRALDQTTGGTTGTVRAYVEAAPRVWVQVGYSHPLAGKVALDEGQFLLVRPPRDWVAMPEGPFADVYDVLKFDLPAAPVEWADAPVREKLTVPLRLVPGNAADAPELWVLRGDAAKQLDGFVRDADERLTQRLRFAVATGPTCETVIVLRVTAAKIAPPVLPLVGAVGFKQYHKLPNLYVPAGARLHPTLRRDAVRKLLADDPDELVWLYPDTDGAFTPETLAEDAFRPLEDWVDYVIETNHAPLAAWVEASRFDFEHFVCTDGPPPKPPKDRDDEKGKRRGKEKTDEPAPRAAEKKETAAPADRPTTNLIEPPRQLAKSEWEVRRKELETRFLATDGPLDHPDRLALWPELAAANDGYGDTAEASLCWVNTLWGAERPPQEWLDGWLRNECPGLRLPVTPAEFDRRLRVSQPTAAEAREFTALLVWLSHQTPPPPWLADRLSAAQKYIEGHERRLPVRAVWLAACGLAALAGADTLGLARVRDRLLQQLLEGGLNPELNQPTFLRFAGVENAEQARSVRLAVGEIHRAVRSWIEEGLNRQKKGPGENHLASLGYTDLLFAFGFAKLGDHSRAKDLRTAAAAVFDQYATAEQARIAADFLGDAYSYRIDKALAGERHGGPLSPELLDHLNDLTARSRADERKNSPLRIAVYAVDRLRHESRILEPQEKVHPYHEQQRSSAGQQREAGYIWDALVELRRIGDPAKLVRRVRELYESSHDGHPTAATRFQVIEAALPVAPRAGELFTLELLSHIPAAARLTAKDGPEGSDLVARQGKLIERGLFLAANYDRRDLVKALTELFGELVQARQGRERTDLVNAAASQAVRSLRRMGLRDEVDRFLTRLERMLLGDLQPTAAVARLDRRTNQWGGPLQNFLHLAGGWLLTGQAEKAEPILAAAERELLGPGARKLLVGDVTDLMRAYISALGCGRPESGLPRVVRLFRALDRTLVTNTQLSNSVFSRLHLAVVEETVLALTGDEFAHGPAGRRWLEEDELLVRRRVHADMRTQLARGGLAG